jgi:hypothetical protein
MWSHAILQVLLSHAEKLLHAEHCSKLFTPMDTTVKHVLPHLRPGSISILTLKFDPTARHGTYVLGA